ncbi:hypothetical protein L211DRAFT_125631 [Terfezia boudieri ATCC MYA-4762]|uniref:Secreted protein n=1 Tax=Terfezia boudieri ATCC MYA-4762 TaxID=1051890 RepID=A0A3N4L6R0_9PEZI|nr:hypothetical protein L211DRAFT_125631 [Terfezia boudieri ATCC MYA-4762]
MDHAPRLPPWVCHFFVLMLGVVLPTSLSPTSSQSDFIYPFLLLRSRSKGEGRTRENPSQIRFTSTSAQPAVEHLVAG